LGNDNWEMRLDKEIYPEIMCNIANGFSELLGDKVNHDKNYRHILADATRKRMYKSLDAFVDYMATNGYVNDNDEDKVRKIEVCFETLVKDLKVIAFNYTKSTTVLPIPVSTSGT